MTCRRRGPSVDVVVDEALNVGALTTVLAAIAVDADAGDKMVAVGMIGGCTNTLSLLRIVVGCTITLSFLRSVLRFICGVASFFCWIAA